MVSVVEIAEYLVTLYDEAVQREALKEGCDRGLSQRTYGRYEESITRIMPNKKLHGIRLPWDKSFAENVLAMYINS